MREAIQNGSITGNVGRFPQHMCESRLLSQKGAHQLHETHDIGHDWVNDGDLCAGTEWDTVSPNVAETTNVNTGRSSRITIR